MSLSAWESNLDDNLVTIDRSGFPIYEIITKRSIPELSTQMILILIKTIQAAINRYYKANTVVGKFMIIFVFIKFNLKKKI